ncbi:hypothetical protein ATANTOWER_013372 [Ataeniobius toweri]|uniref:Engrailed n=1 Tax=Ataeniobius toweri TaxID=208326 RepID=A0ABU7B847_9TELE|nr:hypothetical protein [Ataeniobius toweri]
MVFCPRLIPGSVPRPNQAPLENLPDLAFTAKTSSSDHQIKFQLAASEPPTSSFYQANPIHPPTSGTSGPCPKEKHQNQVPIPEKKDSRFYIYPGLLRVSQTQNDIPPGGPSTPENCSVPRPSSSSFGELT